MHEAHSRAFTVAKITRIDLLSDIQTSLSEAYKKGRGFTEWRDNIKPVLAKKGWLGDVSVTNPKTGEAKQIYVGSRRLKRIFETNIRVSVAKARYESQMGSAGEYFRYKAVLDRRTRPGHAKLHGMILPKTHKFWEKNYPPNDWGCRCQVQVLTQSEMQSYGFKPYAGTPLNVASKDWAYNPGKSVQSLDSVLAKKAANLSGELKNIVKNDLKNYERDRNLYVWQKGLNEAIEQIIIKNDPKTPINMVQVGLLSEALAKVASKILGLDVNGGGIILTKKHLSHASPKRKAAYDHAFRVEEMKQIVSVLNDENKAYVDLRDGHKNILFVFQDEMNDAKINLIPIEVRRVIHKFKQSNYIITLDKADRQKIQEMIDAGFIRKIK
jgi:putative prophage muSo1, F protein|nr:MAG TPA: minor capsid component [Caudoviricetes sp.]